MYHCEYTNNNRCTLGIQKNCALEKLSIVIRFGVIKWMLPLHDDNGETHWSNGCGSHENSSMKLIEETKWFFIGIEKRNKQIFPFRERLKALESRKSSQQGSDFGILFLVQSSVCESFSDCSDNCCCWELTDRSFRATYQSDQISYKNCFFFFIVHTVFIWRSLVLFIMSLWLTRRLQYFMCVWDQKSEQYE